MKLKEALNQELEDLQGEQLPPDYQEFMDNFKAMVEITFKPEELPF